MFSSSYAMRDLSALRAGDLAWLGTVQLLLTVCAFDIDVIVQSVFSGSAACAGIFCQAGKAQLLQSIGCSSAASISSQMLFSQPWLRA
jgi:hypothetical protein